jgi:hypothetical protein
MCKYRNFYHTVKSILQLGVLIGVALLAVTGRHKPTTTTVRGRLLVSLRAYVRFEVLRLLRVY